MKFTTRFFCASALLIFTSTTMLADTICTMHFDLEGWSLFYKTASGSGTIDCEDGQRAAVSITTRGGGPTAGKTQIHDGIGKFTAVASVDDLFGLYVTGGVDAGAGKAASAAVMTKGNVHLALAGTGTGRQLGLSFGKFVIERK